MGPTQTTHVKFSGQAQISPGWTAGYMLRIQNLDDNPFGRNAATGAAMNQDSSRFSTGLNAQMSYWFVQSKDLGKISVGRQATAAKSAAMFTDQSGTQVIDNYTFLAGFPQFFVRSAGDLTPAVTWGQFAFCYQQSVPLGGDCNGIVMNAVRYDTPAFAGFSASASWGEDDFWDVAARYAGEFNGIKIALGCALLGLGTAMVYPTLLAAIGDVAHPSWRGRAVGIYRLWRDGGFAVGAVIAGVIADAVSIPAAVYAVAGLTAVSGVLTWVRMYETNPARR